MLLNQMKSNQLYKHEHCVSGESPTRLENMVCVVSWSLPASHLWAADTSKIRICSVAYVSTVIGKYEVSTMVSLGNDYF